MFLAATCIKTPLACSWGCQVSSLCGAGHAAGIGCVQVCRLLHCSGAPGSAGAGEPSTRSRGARAQSQTRREMSCHGCPLCVPVFAGWGLTSCLAEDGKSNRVCSAVLAEWPNQVQSFGLGEKLSLLQHGLSEELPCAPAPPRASPLLRAEAWEMLGAYIADQLQWVGIFWRSLHTGREAERRVLHTPRAVYEAGNCLMEWL